MGAWGQINVGIAAGGDMERMNKCCESESAKRTVQTKFTSKSREGGMAQRIDTSPAMTAQRRKLDQLFGGVIQRVIEHELLQEQFATTQMKHELGEEEFLPGRFGAA